MRSRTKLLGALVILAACAVNPATGEREFSLVSEGQEIEMGRQADPEVAAQFGIVDDAGLQSYVSGIGTRTTSPTVAGFNPRSESRIAFSICWTMRFSHGETPMVRMASISSVSFIVPICAAKADPERPATMIAVISVPSSRSVIRPTRLMV